MNFVLVLNKCWAPINVTCAYTAISKVYKGDARVVDHQYALYDWDSWVGASGSFDNDVRKVRSVSVSVVVPTVIIDNSYCGNERKMFRITRWNVYVRDNGICQYCGEHYGYDDMNIDHVLPISKGGPTVWTNVVLSCIKCNTRKANKYPMEVGMTLKRKPLGFYASKIRDNFESWKNFVS